jgi:hypothetical protein
MMELMMGGNLKLIRDGVSYESSPIDLRKPEFLFIRSSLTEFYERMIELGVWLNPVDEDLYHVKVWRMLSGSSRFLFVADFDELQIEKPTYNDIDFKVDVARRKQIESIIFAQIGFPVGDFTLIGTKRSAGQLVTLWKYGDNIVQMDFEFVEFNGYDQCPTSWASFSHSASWQDWKEHRLKGVFHKLMIRALTAPMVKEILIRTGETVTLETVPTLAFSVQHGLRQKFSGNRGVYTRLKPSESNYITDLRAMMFMLLSNVPSYISVIEFKSTSSICELLAAYYPKDYRLTVARGFVRSLWHGTNQRLSKNWEEDYHMKHHAITTVYNLLGLIQEDFSDMIREYYRKDIDLHSWSAPRGINRD